MLKGVHIAFIALVAVILCAAVLLPTEDQPQQEPPVPDDVISSFLEADTVLERDTVVPAGTLTVLRCYPGDPGYVNGTNPNGTMGKDRHLFMTLTVPEGVVLTVEGALMVNAVTCQPVWWCDLNVTGGYAQIVNNGRIVVRDGGLLDNFGYISGSGEVSVEDGGEVRDRMSVTHWRGGTTAKFCYDHRIFPITEYSMRNISCMLEVQSGAVLGANMKMHVGGDFRSLCFPWVDDENGIVRLAEGSRLTWFGGKADIHGSADFGACTMDVSGVTASTADFDFPVNGSFGIRLHHGDYRFLSDFKFMPGAGIDADGSHITVGKGVDVSFYESYEDETDWPGTEYPDNRKPAYINLRSSDLDVYGGLGGHIQKDGSSQVLFHEGSSKTVYTDEVKGKKGIKTLTHTVRIIETDS